MTNMSQEELRLNARQFQRLCKDGGVLKPAGRLEPMTADIVFAQCKAAGERSLRYKVNHASTFRRLDLADAFCPSSEGSVEFSIGDLSSSLGFDFLPAMV